MTERLESMSPRYELWIESYAEMLGCDARPASIAVAIQALQDERNRAVASIPEHRKLAQDAIIRSMRQTAVNCGHSSSCAVSHWFKLSTESGE